MSDFEQETGMLEEEKVDQVQEMKEYEEDTNTVKAELTVCKRTQEKLEDLEKKQNVVAVLEKSWKEKNCKELDMSEKPAKSRKVAAVGISGYLVEKVERLLKIYTISTQETSLEMDLSFAAAVPEVGSWFDVGYLYDAGIEQDVQSFKRLYCRQETVTLFNALQSMEKGLRISGPPGVGKSCTVWFWLCQQVFLGKKKVLWIHVAPMLATSYLLLSPEGCFVLELGVSEEIRYIKNSDADFVVIDGLTECYADSTLVRKVFSFYNPKRHAISISSEYLRTNMDDDFNMDITSHRSYPWTFEEYLSAIKDDTFLENARPFLDNESSENTSFDIEENMREKFYYAGCSARWMFARTLDTVCKQLCTHFASVGNYEALLRGSNVNHLSCFYSKHKKFFVSEYIARRALYRGDGKAVRLAYQISQSFQDRSFSDWVVGMDFVQQISNALPNNIAIEGETWEVKGFIESETDLKSLKVFSGRLKHGTWLLPLNYNQGGYDLVCLSNLRGDYLLRFVKVTQSNTYSLRLQHFRNVADAMSSVLSSRGVRVERIEIIMMLATKVQDFTISQSQVKDSGVLESFKVGNSDNMWQKNHEHTLVRTLHFNKSA